MKKHVIVPLLMMILTLAPVLNVHAQTDTDGQAQNDGKKGKKEKKKKEKVKKPSKDDLNTMVNQLNSQVKNLEAENERLKTAVTQKEEEIFQLQDELTAEKLKPAPVVVDPVNVKPEGIAFKVQIGAYQKFNINQYFTETKKISYEDVNGTNKYFIGYFTSLEAAKGFENDMKKMGIKDSWLVPYKDGVRITDEEAESILGQPIRDIKKKK